jgi:hypothetical protein
MNCKEIFREALKNGLYLVGGSIIQNIPRAILKGYTVCPKFFDREAVKRS